MNTIRIAVLGIAIVFGCSLLASAEEKKPEAWGGVVVGKLKATAVVEKVDRSTREVTVKNSDGESTTVVCGPLVRNFDQIQAGDKVSLQYQESVTLMAMSGIEAVPARTESTDVVGAPLGQKPAGVIVKTGEVVAEVTAINHQDRTITLKGPVRTVTVQVDEKARNFDRIKPGDKVYLRSTAALAIVVTAE